MPAPKRPFFKYASPETTRAILRSRSVRYSSPTAFNDPFDIQSGLHFDFEIESLPSAVLERIAHFAAAPDPPPVDPLDPWGKVVLEVRRHYPTHGFPRELWTQHGSAPLQQLANIIRETRQEYENHWRDLLPTIRVFCVSEERDNLLMWAHYGRDHSGAVFEFWSLPEEDNPLSVASPVQYVDDPISFFSKEEFINDILSVRKLDFSALYRRYAYIKSARWQYEREWRVWYPLSESGLYDDMPIRPSEFTSLYLGCRATESFKTEVIASLANSFPNVRVYQAAKADGSYTLAFNAING
jgi:hypothetical protein